MIHKKQTKLLKTTKTTNSNLLQLTFHQVQLSVTPCGQCPVVGHQNKGSALLAMTKPELTAPSAVSELRLLQVLRLIMTLRTSSSSSSTASRGDAAAGSGNAGGGSGSGSSRGRSGSRSGGAGAEGGGGGGRAAGGYPRRARSDTLDEEDLPALINNGNGAGDDLVDASDLPVTAGPNDQVDDRT